MPLGVQEQAGVDKRKNGGGNENGDNYLQTLSISFDRFPLVNL